MDGSKNILKISTGFGFIGPKVSLLKTQQCVNTVYHLQLFPECRKALIKIKIKKLKERNMLAVCVGSLASNTRCSVIFSAIFTNANLAPSGLCKSLWYEFLWDYETVTGFGGTNFSVRYTTECICSRVDTPVESVDWFNMKMPIYRHRKSYCG